MFYPVEVDGRTLVILRRRGWRFSAVASGRLEYDGEALALVEETHERICPYSHATRGNIDFSLEVEGS